MSNLLAFLSYGNRQESDDLGRRHRGDHGLIIIAFLLIALGLVVVQAISPALVAQSARFDRYYTETYFVMKQAIAVVLGIVAFTITATVPIQFWRKVKWHIVGAGIFTSLLAIAVTREVNGASRWIQLGGLSFQPAELVKFGLIIAAASLLAVWIKQHGRLDNRVMKPLLLTLLAIGILVAGLQSDLGSTAVMVSILGSMVFLSGMPLGKIGIVLLIIAAGVTLAVTATPYRRDRLSTFLNPGKDCNSTGLHSCRAVLAVGSGGIFGRQLGKSVQAYGYLPEAANDSIFAVYAETFGFVGSIILLALYGLLFLRILKIVQHSQHLYIRFVCIGIFSWFFVQTAINVGAMIQLLPLKGITLPFISYGGTSIVFVMAGLGLVFQASKYTVARVSYASLKQQGGGDEPSNYAGGRGLGRPRYTVTRSR
jgi:cell division protein FtsW